MSSVRQAYVCKSWLLNTHIDLEDHVVANSNRQNMESIGLAILDKVQVVRHIHHQLLLFP